MRATASATCPRRCLLNRSVLRRSWPKLENQELVRSTGQRRPRVWVFLVLALPLGGFLVLGAPLREVVPLGAPLRAFLAQTTSVSPRRWQRSGWLSGGRGGRWPSMAFQTASATRGSIASKASSC